MENYIKNCINLITSWLYTGQTRENYLKFVENFSKYEYVIDRELSNDNWEHENLWRTLMHYQLLTLFSTVKKDLTTYNEFKKNISKIVEDIDYNNGEEYTCELTKMIYGISIDQNFINKMQNFFDEIKTQLEQKKQKQLNNFYSR